MACAPAPPLVVELLQARSDLIVRQRLLAPLRRHWQYAWRRAPKAQGSPARAAMARAPLAQESLARAPLARSLLAFPALLALLVLPAQNLRRPPQPALAHLQMPLLEVAVVALLLLLPPVPAPAVLRQLLHLVPQFVAAGGGPRKCAFRYRRR